MEPILKVVMTEAVKSLLRAQSAGGHVNKKTESMINMYITSSRLQNSFFAKNIKKCHCTVPCPNPHV